MNLKTMQAQNDKVEKIIDHFLVLKNKSSASEKSKREFEEYQNFCMQELNFLIQKRVGKYKKFSNYQDLQQDGYEALLYALKTFRRDKGCFSWWADKYISTRISRAANTHSTIRFPLKTAKENKPHKISLDCTASVVNNESQKNSQLPIMLDDSMNGLQTLEYLEDVKLVNIAINLIEEPYKKILCLTFGLNGEQILNVTQITQQLQISRNHYSKLLNEGKEKIKEVLASYQYSEK